jgi:hypothetical protein
MLEENGDQKPLGQHWPTRFIQRHSELTTGRSLTLSKSRAQGLDADTISYYFDNLKSQINDFEVLRKDTYNIDKKGF